MKFSIVTPTYNSERFVGEAIESVISQVGDFSIEIFVMDGGSTDGTQAVVQSFQKLLSENTYPIQCNEVVIYWNSEKDGGMYDAIKNGFSRATGDVYAWINSDDLYLPGAFGIIQQTLEKFPEISWLKGVTSYINENSTIYAVGQCNLYQRDWVEKGLYGPVLHFIQQDSVFWRTNLWDKSGGVDDSLTLAGDYFLWKSFAKFTPLYSLKAYVSCFRKVPSQKSADINAYFEEIEKVSPLEKRLVWKFRRYFMVIEALPKFLRSLCYRLLFGKHEYNLVFLDNAMGLRLIKDEYYELKDLL